MGTSMRWCRSRPRCLPMRQSPLRWACRGWRGKGSELGWNLRERLSQDRRVEFVLSHLTTTASLGWGTQGRWLTCNHFHFLERLGVRGAQHAALRDDRGDVFRGGHVEGGIADADAMRGELLSAMMGDFDRGALLDGDGVAGRSGRIDSGPGSGHIKRDAVFFGEDGDVVRADFIGGIAVGGDAVGAYNDGLDAAGAHEAGSHVVANHGGGDAVGHQFPGGEARTLKEGASFVGVDVDLLALLDGGADNAESGSIAAGGQGPGVAM